MQLNVEAVKTTRICIYIQHFELDRGTFWISLFYSTSIFIFEVNFEREKTPTQLHCSL